MKILFYVLIVLSLSFTLFSQEESEEEVFEVKEQVEMAEEEDSILSPEELDEQVNAHKASKGQKDESKEEAKEEFEEDIKEISQGGGANTEEVELKQESDPDKLINVKDQRITYKVFGTCKSKNLVLGSKMKSYLKAKCVGAKILPQRISDCLSSKYELKCDDGQPHYLAVTSQCLPSILDAKELLLLKGMRQLKEICPVRRVH